MFFLKKIKRNVCIGEYTTFKIGGRADYFLKVKNEEDLKKAIKWSRQKRLPFFILGGGSNLLVSDQGFRGLVIKIEFKNFKTRAAEIFAGAGVKLDTLVKIAEKKGLAGLEWAAGIPGVIGGAIRGNAAAFGHSISELVKETKVLNSDNLKTQVLKTKPLKFSYKNSIIKEKKNLIIVSTKLKLKKGNKKELKEKIKENLRYRQKNHPLQYPSAGCIFKNHCGIAGIKNQELLKKFRQRNEIPAGYLIEQSGLKGIQIGQVKISDKHSNFIINLNQETGKKKRKTAKAEDVLNLINITKKKVKNKFKIELKEEIEYIR